MSVVRAPKLLRSASIAAVGAIIASACGARSALRMSAGAGAGSGGAAMGSASAGAGGGAGGVGASGSAGGGGGGGGAGGASLIGPPTACGMAVLATPILTVDAPEHGNAVQPSLVVIPTPAPPSAAVAYVWQPSALGAYITARVASFDGWGTWPPAALTYADVQNTETGLPLSGVTLLAQSDPSLGPASFDLLYVPTQSDEGGSFDNMPVTSCSTGVDGSTPLAQIPNSGTSAFLATGTRSGESWSCAVNVLAGVIVQPFASGFPPYALAATPGPNFGGGSHWMGCSTTPLAADAVTADAGWLVAAGLGSPLGWPAGNGFGSTCGPTSTGIGPGTALTVGTLDSSISSGEWLTQTQVIAQAASPVARIRMANRPAVAGGGTWIVWSVDGAPTLTAGVLSSELALGFTFSIAAAGGTLVPASFAVEAFGAELVVAAVDQVAGSNDQVQVTAMDASGVMTWSATVQTEGAVEGAVSLRAAPDGSSLLLAWSELPPGGTAHRIRVARLGCTTCAADGAACAAASDCCGARCDHATCATAVTLVGTVCKSDAECSGEDTCAPTLGVCVNDTLCKSDADCTWANDVCNTAISLCMTGGDACTHDTDCPPGERCDPNKGGVCLPGTCAAKGAACASDHDCCNLACDPASGSCT